MNRLLIAGGVLLLSSMAVNTILWMDRCRLQDEMSVLRVDNAVLRDARKADDKSQTITQQMVKEANHAARQSHDAIDAALATGNTDLLPELCRVLKNTAARASHPACEPDGTMPGAEHAGGNHADK